MPLGNLIYYIMVDGIDVSPTPGVLTFASAPAVPLEVPSPLLCLASFHIPIQTRSFCSILGELGGHPLMTSTLLKFSSSGSTCCHLLPFAPPLPATLRQELHEFYLHGIQ